MWFLVKSKLQTVIKLLVNTQTLSLFFVAISVVLIWRNFQGLPAAVPLWFSKPWGEAWLAEPRWLWLIPSMNFMLVIANFGLGKFFERKEPVISKILLWSNVVISILFFFTLFEIVRVSI